MPFRTPSYLFMLTLVMLVTACDSGTGDEPSGEAFDRQALIAHLGNDVILPSYRALQQAVDALEEATTRFTEAPSADRLDAVQSRLRTARLAWQDANLFQFGPAEQAVLRASLNTYPVDEAQVEENIASGDYALGTIVNRDAAGFPAIGYLVHGLGDTDEEIVAAYTDAAGAAARAVYLQDNVAFVAQAVDATVEGWAADGGDYIGTFLSEGNAGTDVGSSLGMLINAYVMHYERYIRDGKIGIPAGVRSAGVARPTSTEAYYGGYSVDLALANLRAARRLFAGNRLSGEEGTGLDDYLEELDAEALAEQIVTEYDEAIAALEALGDPLSEQIEQDNDPVLAAFQELQDVIVLLKADMTSLLGITITYQDNDGD